MAEEVKDTSEDQDDVESVLPEYEDDEEADDRKESAKGAKKEKKAKADKKSKDEIKLPQINSVDDFVNAVGSLVGIGHVTDLSKSKVLKGSDRISTNSLELDIALGGGIPRGRVTEIYGPESSGKTTILLNILKGPSMTEKIFFADEEGTLDDDWASKNGVNVANVTLSRGEVAEVSLAMLELAVKSGIYSVAVLDSVAALVPEKEFHGNYSDSHMGVLARLLARFCRKAYSSVNFVRRTMGKNVTVILTNQIRMKIGVMWGNPEVTTGGKSIPFLASVRIDLRKDEMMKNSKDEVYGQITRFTVVKNKTAPPLKKGNIRFFTDGPFKGQIDNFTPLLEWGIRFGVVKKSGAWYQVGNDKFQGESKAYEFFKSRGAKYCNKLITDIEKEVGYPICFRF